MASDRGPDSVEHSATGPRSIWRKVGGPLVLYHALVLFGAYLTIRGILDGEPADEYVGVGVIIGGIAVEAAVLAWSAGLTRRAAAVARTVGESGADRTPERRAGTAQCVRCAWEGVAEGSVCPRCGGFLVRPPSLSTPAGEQA